MEIAEIKWRVPSGWKLARGQNVHSKTTLVQKPYNQPRKNKKIQSKSKQRKNRRNCDNMKIRTTLQPEEIEQVSKVKHKVDLFITKNKTNRVKNV